MNKEQTLKDFIESFRSLPQQRSKKWLEDRKYTIGGSEMSIVVGYNPYKKPKDLVKQKLGMSEPFKGNINTYWGTVLEDLVVLILEQKWDCKIYETGSLPGVIPEQKYSPDGLTYLKFLDMIVLIEIKCAARRVSDGKVPRMYKPQIYTGLDTIKIADIGLFIDNVFRRCPVNNLDFTTSYDTELHPDTKFDEPVALCLLCIYEELYTTDYDDIKNKYKKKKDEWIDAGSCCTEDLELLLSDIADKKLKTFIPSIVDMDDENKIKKMFEDFEHFLISNNNEPIAILPLKLFKMDIIPVYRDDWKKVYNYKTKNWENSENNEINENSYVLKHQDTIKEIIDNIKKIEKLKGLKQFKKLDKLYPEVVKTKYI